MGTKEKYEPGKEAMHMKVGIAIMLVILLELVMVCIGKGIYILIRIIKEC